MNTNRVTIYLLSLLLGLTTVDSALAFPQHGDINVRNVMDALNAKNELPAYGPPAYLGTSSELAFEQAPPIIHAPTIVDASQMSDYESQRVVQTGKAVSHAFRHVESPTPKILRAGTTKLEPVKPNSTETDDFTDKSRISRVKLGGKASTPTGTQKAALSSPERTVYIPTGTPLLFPRGAIQISPRPNRPTNSQSFSVLEPDKTNRGASPNLDAQTGSGQVARKELTREPEFKKLRLPGKFDSTTQAEVAIRMEAPSSDRRSGPKGFSLSDVPPLRLPAEKRRVEYPVARTAAVPPRPKQSNYKKSEWQPRNLNKPNFKTFVPGILKLNSPAPQQEEFLVDDPTESFKPRPLPLVAPETWNAEQSSDTKLR